MTTLKRDALSVALLSVAAIGAHAQVSSINSAVVQTRVFNDVPGAILVSALQYPTSISFTELGVSASSGFANRDVWHFSADNTTPYSFANDDFFQVSMDVTLTGTPNSPRKEAGFLLSSIGGDGQFILNTDAHEVVAFGGPFPFFAFAPTFNSGDTVTLAMTYFLDSLTGQRSIIYSANGVSSPTLPFTNLEQGIIDGSTLGGYLQIVNDPANPGNSGLAEFTRIAIPEPPPLGLLAFGILPLFRRLKR